jgi:hypothetical protein
VRKADSGYRCCFTRDKVVVVEVSCEVRLIARLDDGGDTGGEGSALGSPMMTAPTTSLFDCLLPKASLL